MQSSHSSTSLSSHEEVSSSSLRENIRKIPSGRMESRRGNKRAKSMHSLFVGRYMVTKDNDFRTLNSVGLSSRACKKLFGQERQGRVRVANMIYPAKLVELPQEFDILFSDISAGQIEDSTSSYACLRSVNGRSLRVGYLSALSLSVRVEGPLRGEIPSTEQHQVSKTSLEEMVKKLLEGDIVSSEKRLFIEHPVGPLSLEVYRMEMLELEEEQAHPLIAVQYSPVAFHLASKNAHPPYGIITENTRLYFHSEETNKLAIVEEVPNHLIHAFEFTITKVENLRERQFFSDVDAAGNRYDWTQGAPLLPIVAPLDEMCAAIRNRFSGRTLKELDAEQVPFDSWTLTVQFKKVRLKPDIELTSSFAEEESTNVKGYELQNSNRLIINSCRQVRLTCSEEWTVSPQDMSFELVDSHCPAIDENNVNALQWVSLPELERALRNNQPRMTLQSTIKVETSRGLYQLKVMAASGYENFPATEFKNASPLFRIAPSTKLHINMGVADSTIIAESDEPTFAKKVKLQVTKFSPVFRKPKFFLSKSEKKASTLIDRDELASLFRSTFDHDNYFIKGQQISLTTARGEVLSLQISSVEAVAQEVEGEYACLYMLQDDTELELEVAEGQNLLLSGRREPLQIRDIAEKMHELGIGGLGPQFKLIIKKILLARTEYASHLKKVKQTPPRGILLYGPPGTGKTKVARALQQLLQIPEQNARMINGSEIWNKWVGESEHKVRELFQRAQEDQKKYGPQSPLHLLIIDEIDSFLQPRESSDRSYQKSVVDAFIASLDGISSQSSESLNNIIVIGLTNFKDQIDPAVLRPGRLGTHIHIGLPDAEGRKEIFQIYLAPLYQEGLIAEDVNVDQLVAWTVGRTGAFIEAVVQTATSYSTDRIYENRIPTEELSSHALAKVSHSDLLQAIEECKWQKTHEDIATLSTATYSTDFSIESLREDLSRKGLVALPEEVLEFFSQLRIREKHCIDLRGMGLRFRRGALFYGAPGTGKTEAAKAIKDLFALDSSRFQYVRISELWADTGESLRKNIARLVQPAKEAANDLHGNAPLYVLVLDNIDALYWRFNHPDRVDASVLQRFLSELDSLLDDGDRQLDNLVVIGIANRPFPLEANVIQSSALSTHIRFEAPDREGRRAILEKKLSGHSQRDLLGEDVDIERLASLTEGMTPVEIETFITTAQIHAVRKAPSFTLHSLTMEDFEAALERRREENNEQKALSMYC